MVALKSNAGQEIRRLLEWQEAVAQADQAAKKLGIDGETPEVQPEERVRMDGITVYNPHDLVRIAGDAIIEIIKGNEAVLKTFVHVLDAKAKHSNAKVKSAKWDNKGNIEVDFEDLEPVSGKQHAIA
jgi:DNA gyrase inhibitor GyrI